MSSPIHEKNRQASEENEPGTSKVAQHTPSAVEEPPDGGYGWVIVVCVFMANGRLCPL